MHLQKETSALNPDHLTTQTLADIYHQISALPPRVVDAFVPQDASEQRTLFLDGAIRNPIHTYARFDDVNPDADAQAIRELAQTLTEFADTDPVSYVAYEEYARRNALTHEFIAAARDTHSPDGDVAAAARKRFMELNVELYGAPDETTFNALIAETRQRLGEKRLGEEAGKIRDELFELLPVSDAEGERYVPSSETVAKMKDVAEYLYGRMLSHIPSDKETFDPEETAAIFRAIIRDEFEQAGDGWEVVVMPTTSISVAASQKKIKIPEARDPISIEKLRGLIVHELGVHMMRSVMGGQTDLPLLSTDMSDYYDAEEGLGKVMEQAINGKYEDSGVSYYQAAGLIYFDNLDFRATHEIMWRIEALKEVKDGADLTEDEREKAKQKAYKTVLRLTHGTDDLLWFKDLAYYNGSAKMWRYCEAASDDPEQFMFLLMGKSDVTNAQHRRVLLETRTP